MSAEVTQILTRIVRAGPSNATDTAVNTGDQIVFTLVTDFPIYAPGDLTYYPYYGLVQRPTLTLSNGAVATDRGVDAQGRLEFSYSVGSNQDVADLTVTGFGAQGGIPLPKNIYFDQKRTIDTLSDGDRGAIGDANQDGRPDIIITQSSGNTITYLNDGDRGFSKASQPFPPFEAASFTNSVTADIDADGVDDLVRYVNDKYLPPGGKFLVDYSAVEILRGRGDGTFEDVRLFVSDRNISGIALADIDSDGRLDVVTTSAKYFGLGGSQDPLLSYLLNASVFGQTQFDAASVGTAAGSRTGIRVDMTAPVVAGVTAGGPGIVNGTGTLVTGQTAAITLTLSESVIVTNAGRLVLSLNDGGQATYDAAASTGTQLVFRHTVAVDQGTSDLTVTGLVPNGAAIRDLAGNEAVLSGAVANPAGTLRIDGFIGTAGNDVFRGRGGAETFRGLAGDDSYFVDTAQDVVIEAAGQGYDTITTSVSYALRDGQEIEVLQAQVLPDGSGTGLKLTGNALKQTLRGGNWDDTLEGGAGADVMQGKGGNDTYSVDNVGDRVLEVVGGGVDRVFSTISYALSAGQEVEFLQLLASTGTAKLNVTGNEFAQTLGGNAGANVLDGKGGADTMIGGKGDDTYVVDDLGDQVVEAAGQGNDRVLASTSYALAGGQSVETMQLLEQGGTTQFYLRGNELAQTLIGNASANVLDGKGGADTMIGGSGSDTYAVDDARDVVREAVGGGYDTVVTETSYRLAAGQEIELVRIASSASRFNIDLTGNEFGQALRGGDGNNVLDGKGGADVMTGGRGQDAFVFSTALGNGNVDRIVDFAPVDDTIRLSEAVFSALAPGPLAGSAFKNISIGKVDADDRVLFKQATGELFYDADGSGKGAAVKFATLDGQPKLTHDDFFVI
ncbi:FG-GAP-like repeat-containing protein [Methylorubrum sp. SB2]|uniref:FG-GAP-like repeat-containing protein n=1 Tax=Methylorubrum subtropicum TaxID=3138812 RepID=UPI00313DF5D5